MAGASRNLRLSPVAGENHAEVLFFIERHRLMGRGIGYVDAHLLVAAALFESAGLWSHDRRLRNVAVDLNLAYEPAHLR